MNNSTTILAKVAEANKTVNANGVVALDPLKGTAGVRKQMFIARKVTGFGTGKQDLLEDQEKKIGVSSFDKNKLPSGKSYLVIGLKVLQSTDDALAPELSSFERVSTPAILNGNISFNQSGEINEFMISELTPESDGNGDVGKGYYECFPFRLQGTDDVNIITQFTGAPTAGHSIKVVLDVIEETVNAKVAASVMSNCQ